MTTITHYLCIGCPLGCRLEVEEEQEQIVAIRGFACKLGKAYAQREHTDPRRMVTTTVAITGGLWARLPVATTAPVPKDKVQAVCAALRRVRLNAPAELGQVVVSDILGTGADVVATRAMPAPETLPDQESCV
jgi:CxxC motif-containing protein